MGGSGNSPRLRNHMRKDYRFICFFISIARYTHERLLFGTIHEARRLHDKAAKKFNMSVF